MNYTACQRCGKALERPVKARPNRDSILCVPCLRQARKQIQLSDIDARWARMLETYRLNPLNPLR